MAPNQTHKIEHSSAMYYQLFNITHESSKTVTIKSIRSFNLVFLIGL